VAAAIDSGLSDRGSKGRACPKCGYIRKPTDTAPDWQCPSCGIAYAKYGTVAHGHAHNLEAGASPAETVIASHPVEPTAIREAVTERQVVVNASPASATAPASGGKNILSLNQQIGHTLVALFLLGYGTYGFMVDEIIVPGKKSSITLHGWSVWVIFGAMICAALVLLSVVVDNYDPRDDERYYHIFAHVFQGLGWTLFVVAIYGQLFAESAPREYVKARALAEKGDAAAQYSVGHYFWYGGDVRQNFAEALIWLRKSAAQGDADAMNLIGYMNFYGQGVPVNLAEAEIWYRRGAMVGSARAQNNLGLMYFDLQIRPKDYEQAVEWFRKAAEQGNARALYNLGRAYEQGKGVEQDWVQAHMWYSLAGRAGFDYGGKRAKTLESDMDAADIAQANSLAQQWQATHSYAK
jgi:TPR repeat protein